MYTQLYGSLKTFFQMIGTGTLAKSRLWDKELADAEASNAQAVKAAQEAKAARDAKGPGKGKRRGRGTGDVSAPGPTAKKARTELEERISGVQGSRKLPRSHEAMQVAVDDCCLPNVLEFQSSATPKKPRFVRLKYPSDDDFPKKVKPRTPGAQAAAQARAADSRVARIKPGMPGVIPAKAPPPANPAMPRDIKGYPAQGSHFPTQRRTKRDEAIVNTLQTGERRAYRPEENRFVEAWKRAEKRGAEERATSGVSAEAATDASGGGSSWSGDDRWGWAGDKGTWAGSSWGDKKPRAWWDDNRHTDR